MMGNLGSLMLFAETSLLTEGTTPLSARIGGAPQIVKHLRLEMKNWNLRSGMSIWATTDDKKLWRGDIHVWENKHAKISMKLVANERMATNGEISEQSDTLGLYSVGRMVVHLSGIPDMGTADGRSRRGITSSYICSTFENGSRAEFKFEPSISSVVIGELGRLMIFVEN